MGKFVFRCTTFFLIAGISILLSACATQKQQLPAQSHDGLDLVKGTQYETVYVKTGADLSAYDRVAILDCYVAFKKHWLQDQNDTRVALENRVTQKDMDRIKKTLSDEFLKVFTKELEVNGGYEVVDKGEEDVLLIRPAIINLDVTAPDTMSPGMTQTFAADPGQMTLYMELYDSATNAIIARVSDTQGGRSTGMIQISNRVTNNAEADRILRKWADILRQKLDEVHKLPRTKP